jgi:hypothetical protein
LLLVSYSFIEGDIEGLSELSVTVIKATVLHIKGSCNVCRTSATYEVLSIKSYRSVDIHVYSVRDDVGIDSHSVQGADKEGVGFLGDKFCVCEIFGSVFIIVAPNKCSRGICLRVLTGSEAVGGRSSDNVVCTTGDGGIRCINLILKSSTNSYIRGIYFILSSSSY